MARDVVQLNTKCALCGKNAWHAYSSHLRCECGQRLWIVRTTDHGTRFTFAQGADLPAKYPGWRAVTA